MRLNDSIVNFYLEYSLTEYVKKELVAKQIFAEAVENVKKQTPLTRREQTLLRKYKSVTNRFYVFSTFFYPMMRKLKQIRDPEEKEKAIKRLLKWSVEIDLFEREFVLIPVITGWPPSFGFTCRGHWSLAALCYPNCLYRYIKEKRVLFGINYARVVRKTDVNSKGNAADGSTDTAVNASVDSSINAPANTSTNAPVNASTNAQPETKRTKQSTNDCFVQTKRRNDD